MSSNSTATSPFDFEKFIAERRNAFDRCLDVVEHQASCNSNNNRVKARLHHLKFDGNCRPMIEALAEQLYEQIIDYCLAARLRPEVWTPQQAARFTKEARKLFIHPKPKPDDPDTTGDAGEILLYFLIEAILGAPQIVAKMELKTNSNDEVKGSDGIHMRWNSEEELVEMYFGEAKLYQDVSKAITAAVTSINGFHASDMLAHECVMVTKHFKFTGEKIQEVVSDLLESGVPGSGVRIQHACLIGYSWDGYDKLKQNTVKAIRTEFQAAFIADAPRLHELLESKFEKFQRKDLIFEVFFIPFPAVQIFRDAFNKALN